MKIAQNFSTVSGGLAERSATVSWAERRSMAKNLSEKKGIFRNFVVTATGALKFLVIYSQKWYKFVSELLKFLVEVNDMSREPTRAAILIRESRKRAGLTQQALAEKLGITTSAVCNYESGASFPKAEMVFGLCDILDLTPRDLFECE